MVTTVSFVVSGRVQGVGFRYHTQNMAVQLCLAGWVRNRADGDVEGILQGSSRDVEAMLARLEKGPTYARVKQLRSDPIEGETSLFESFQITR